MKKIRDFLYKKKRKVYEFPYQSLQNVFWERNIDNLYYGHYSILKNYSKTFLPYKINGEVQHGWSPNSGITSEFSSISSLKKNRYYLFNEDNKKKAIKAGYKNIITIGSPFIYIHNPEQYYLPMIPKSLICFPTHNHEWAGFKNILNTYKKYCDDLKKISNNFKKITISLFWKEYENPEIIKIFKKQGFSVITMGPRDNNPKFLLNFINNVSKYEFLSSDTFSSAIFYGLFMKKKVFIYSYLIEENELWGEENKSAEEDNNTYVTKYPELMWSNFMTKSHYQIGEKELGYKFKLSPKEMRAIFRWSVRKIF